MRERQQSSPRLPCLSRQRQEPTVLGLLAQHAETEKGTDTENKRRGVPPTQGITTSGVKPPDFLILFLLPPLSPSTLALSAWVSFLSWSLLSSSQKRRKGRKGREVGSLGERISCFQPAQTRILFAGSSFRSPAAHPQPGGPGITPAQRPGLLESGVKSVWATEDIADPVAKDSHNSRLCAAGWC